MATTKKSTKAKTKTTKAKKPTAARAKQASTVKAKVATSTKPSGVNTLLLRRLHIISIGVFGVLTVLAVLFMNSSSVQVVINHLSQDTLSESQALLPAVSHLYDIQLRWLVTATLVVSMVLPLLYLTKFEARYKLGLQNKLMPWRWVDIAVTGALMIEVVALLSGVNEVSALKLVGFMAVVMAISGWLAERENMSATKPIVATFWVGILTKIVLLSVVATVAIGTPVFGMVRASWYVYALYGILAVDVLAYTMNHYRQLLGQDYVKSERNYLVYNLVGKSAFALILIFGLMK